jgi:hypothetical protein
MERGSADVVTAIDDLVEAIGETCEDADAVVGAAKDLRARAAASPSLGAALSQEDPPVLQEVAALHQRLGESLSRLRRAEAAQLRREGETVEQIAERFGVSRQRISALLRSR